MVAPSTGSVVLVPFPFSDLSQSKLRPAIVLARGDRDDWVLCQVTSKPYGDRRALELRDADFGGLRVSSFARPAKLFTAHQSHGQMSARFFGCLPEVCWSLGSDGAWKAFNGMYRVHQTGIRSPP